jgi:hypothetical protein
LALFYQQNCVYLQDNSGQNDLQANGDKVVQSASDSASTVDNVGLWLGIFGSIVGLLAFASGIIIWCKRIVSFAKRLLWWVAYGPQRRTGRWWDLDPPPRLQTMWTSGCRYLNEVRPRYRLKRNNSHEGGHIHRLSLQDQ